MYFEHVITQTTVQLSYKDNEAEFKSDSISTLIIIREYL
jgi:hypothetical protein